LAGLYGERTQPPEAVKVLDEARKKHEGALGNDKERAGWVAILRYHHGVALMEAGKAAEARGLFDHGAQPAGGEPVGGGGGPARRAVPILRSKTESRSRPAEAGRRRQA